MPSVANFRISWLNDRLTAAQLASLAAEASPTGDVPPSLQRRAAAHGPGRVPWSLKRNEQRQLILQADMPAAIDQTYDLTMIGRGSPGAEALRQALGRSGDALASSSPARASACSASSAGPATAPAS